jgi:putative tryptophan/tyrosine transport system substrate-binding protein
MFNWSCFSAKRGKWHSLLAICVSVVLSGMVGACDETPPEPKTYRIGLVTNNPNGMKNVQGFRHGLTKLGYVEGKNTTYVTKDKPVRGETLRAVLADLVSSKVDLIFTAGTPTGVAAHRAIAGSNTPVIFGVIADPVAAGVMTNLSNPGGNMSGVMLSKYQSKRLELFLQVAPGIKRLAVLYNPHDSAPTSAVAQMELAANSMNVELIKLECPDNAAVTQALASLPRDIDGIFMVPDSVVNKRVKDIVKLSLARKLVVSGPSTAQIYQGALMTFGFIHQEVGAQAARIADLVLKGTKIGNLPVETAESHLGLNLQTAKSIGLDIPDDLVQQARVVVQVSN